MSDQQATYARLIRVNIEQAFEKWYSSSPDMVGLVADARTGPELLGKLPEIIRLTFKALGEDVTVHRALMASGVEACAVMRCAAVFIVVGTKAMSRMVSVSLSNDEAGWHAHSDDLPGFRALDHSHDAVVKLSAKMIKASIEADTGRPVAVDIESVDQSAVSFAVTPRAWSSCRP